MQNLSDYIISSNLSSIDESLLSHLAIEYKVNDIGEGRNLVNEKYGIYDGCEELADHIVKDIFNSDSLDNEFRYTIGELDGFKNVFFEELIVDLDTSSDDGGECDDNINISKNLLVEEALINIYSTTPTKSEIKGILMHELTHIYNNYMMQLKGNMNYIKAANSEMYRNITRIGGGAAEDDIKQILYFLVGYERNAFIAQLRSELDQHRSKIKTPLDALKVLKQCPVYKAYVRVNNLIQYHIDKHIEDPESEMVAKIYKQITGDVNSEETTTKILKRLKLQSNKAMKKLDSIIPKLCVENLNNIKWRREVPL